MYQTINLDADGRIVVLWKPSLADLTSFVSPEKKHESITHLRRMLAANFIGRSAIKVADFWPFKTVVA